MYVSMYVYNDDINYANKTLNVCVCMYVCVYRRHQLCQQDLKCMCMYVCMCDSIYMCVYLFMYVYMYAFMYV